MSWFLKVFYDQEPSTEPTFLVALQLNFILLKTKTLNLSNNTLTYAGQNCRQTIPVSVPSSSTAVPLQCVRGLIEKWINISRIDDFLKAANASLKCQCTFCVNADNSSPCGCFSFWRMIRIKFLFLMLSIFFFKITIYHHAINFTLLYYTLF